MNLEHLKQPDIKLYSADFDQKPAGTFEVDKEKLEDIFSLISVIQDAFIIPLEMKGDSNPNAIISALKRNYGPQLANVQLSSDAWNDNRTNKQLINKRNEYFNILFLLSKVKVLFVYGVNAIIDDSESVSYLNESYDESEFEEFVKRDNSNEKNIEYPEVLRYYIFKWVEAFYEVFVGESKKVNIFRTRLYELYRTNPLQKFLDISSVLVNQEIDKKYNEYVKNIAFTYFAIKTPRENVERKLKPITDAIERISKLHPEIKQKYIEKKRGCLAGMKYNHRQYAAISGIEVKGEDELASVLGDRYGISLVRLTDSVRYYIGNTHYITYLDLKTWKQTHYLEDRFLRMFSCCERKLFTICDKNSRGEDLRLYVTLRPCPMCVRSIERVKKEYNVNILLQCLYEKKELYYLDEKDYIELANKIIKYEG